MLANEISIVFRGLDHSDALEKRIREETAKLEKVFDRIIGGTVTVELPHRHEGGSQLYEIHIRLNVPGIGELVVSQDTGKSKEHDNAHRAVRDAFAAARRQLKQRVEKMQGKVKHHDDGANIPAAGAHSV